MENAKLTSKELKTFESLVRLGDSKELALETVIMERESEAKKEAARAFYLNAYTN